MSQSSENSDLIERLIDRGLEGGGRIAQGLFSSPWTGIPTALLIMSQIDPSGKLTNQFLANLGTFLSALGKTITDVIVSGINAWNKTPPSTIPPPALLGEGAFCFTVQLSQIGQLLSFLIPASFIPPIGGCFLSAEARDAALEVTRKSLGPLEPFFFFGKVNR